MTHACPPSCLPPLLEPLEPRLLLASAITINDPPISQGGAGTGTIVDDDPPPSLTINHVQVTEGDAGTVNAVFTVTLAPVSSRTVTVNWASADGTAVSPADYAAASGILTFYPGWTTRTVTVALKGDVVGEFDETFKVNLSVPSNATVAHGTGVGTIIDDDPLPAISISDVHVLEGNAGTVNAVFTITLAPVSGRVVTVNYATANGTALAPADYAAAGGTLTFLEGETTKTITVAVKGDVVDEFDETFKVNLSLPINATVADGQGVGTILDDDLAPSPLRWTGAADDHWENAANWYAGILPGPATTVGFSGPVLHMPALYQDQEVRGLEFLSAGWIIRGQGHTLTVGAGGINSAGTSAVEPNVALGADSTWTLGNNSTLVLRGMLRGGGHTLTKDGAGTLVLAGGQDQASGLAMDLAAGTVRLAPAAGPLVLSDLSVAAAGATLDLTDNDLILDYTGGTPGVPSPEFENVKAWLAGGYAGMTWTGSGITSSAAALDPLMFGLGYTQNDMLFLPYEEFSGVPVDSSTILVKFTYLGDLNLDGCVDDNDVTFFNLFYDGGIATSHYWNEGDIFGYDGRIDDNDVTILGLTYGLGIGSPLGGAATTGVGLEAPAAAKLPPAAARAPSAVTLGAMGSAPDAVALAIAMGIHPDPTLAATADPADSTSASGAEALLAEAAAPVQDANVAYPSAARDLASPAPPLVWRSADQGTPVAAAEGAALDLLSLPALDVLCCA